jgi:Zn-dependent protease
VALLNDLTLPQLLSRLVAFLALTAIHGLLLAAIVRLLGDPTPRYNGRLTLNPLAHLSLLALVMAMLFELGWIAPMKISADKLRLGRFGLVVAWLGSLLLTLCIVPLVSPLRPLMVTLLPRNAAFVVLELLDALQDLTIWFVAFNLLPVPPLAGALLLVAIWPRLGPFFARHARLIEALMVALVVIGAANLVVDPINAAIRIVVSY